MKKLLLVISTLSCGLTAYAQAPGYQGKKMSIGYSPGFSLALSQINSKHKSAKLYNSIFGSGAEEISKSRKFGFMPLNVTHAVDFHFVYSRRASLIASLTYAKSATYFEGEETTNYNYVTGQQTVTIEGDTFASMSAVGFLAGLKNYFYRLAPLGGYITYKVGINRYSSDIPWLSVENKPNGVYDILYESKKYSWTNLRLIWGFGKQVVIKDKILFEFGADWDITSFAKGMKRKPYRPTGSGYYYGNLEEYCDEVNAYSTALTKRRSGSRDAFTLDIGFTYLL